LTAAGLVGERPFCNLLAQLPPLTEEVYETGLRCATGPLPTAGQLLLPGTSWPVPRIPLLDQS
jgi:hypothetical protein